jgi:hypothetical protein
VGSAAGELRSWELVDGLVCTTGAPTEESAQHQGESLGPNLILSVGHPWRSPHTRVMTNERSGGIWDSHVTGIMQRDCQGR